jgi:hypothetical protein
MPFPRKKDGAVRKSPKLTKKGSFVGFRKVHEETTTEHGRAFSLTIHIPNQNKRSYESLIGLARSRKDGIVRFAGGAIRIRVQETGEKHGGNQEDAET